MATVKASEGAPQLGLSMGQAARAIGISERSLWTLANSGRIPHKRIGRRIVFSVDELRRWLAAAEQQGTSDE